MRKLLTTLMTMALLGFAWPALAQLVEIKDPTGDDNGSGKYTYPTDAVYKKGSFDITSFTVKDKGDDVEFEVSVNSKIEDPWNSKAWAGNGFSVQMVFIHIDTDHKAGSGHDVGLPGTNVKFAPESGWEKCVIISPQGPTRLNSEIDTKAQALKKDIIVPTKSGSKGKTLFAIVKKSDLGAAPAKGWGYQVLMQSNEGFPAKTDLLTRKVNEFEGQHRFGGGSDHDCDPHVIDILVAPGKGGADEVEGQRKVLSDWSCGADPKNPAGAGYKQAILPMVYP